MSPAMNNNAVAIPSGREPEPYFASTQTEASAKTCPSNCGSAEPRLPSNQRPNMHSTRAAENAALTASLVMSQVMAKHSAEMTASEIQESLRPAMMASPVRR